MAIVSVSVVAGADYYASGGGATYYAAEETVERLWLGTGAEKLGITGEVTASKLGALFQGFHPDGRPLVQNAGSEKRQPGWELCFIVDKAVGVKLAATKDFAERVAILSAVVDAVRDTFSKIEREAGSTRRGHGGKAREPVGLVAAAVFHHENRNGEPFPHVHVPIANVGVRVDGTTGTLWSKDFYDLQKEFGQWFTDRLFERLQTLGVRVERTEHGLHLPEVPRELLEALSSRRKEIVAEMERKGVHGPKAAEVAAKATRREKERNSTHEEVRERWKDLIESHGYRPEPLNLKTRPSVSHERERPEDQKKEKTREREPSASKASPVEKPFDLKAAVRDAIRKTADRRNHFSEQDVLRTLNAPRAGKESAEIPFSEKDVRKTVREGLARAKDVVRLKDERFTTKENLKTEEKLLRAAKRLSGRKPSRVKAKLVEQVIKKYVALSEEERPAVRHVTAPGKGSLRLVEAHTGTDRYSFLVAAGDLWQKAENRVIACSPTNSSADVFRRETRMKTYSVQGLLAAIKGPTLAGQLAYHASQILRAAAKRPTWAASRFIDEKTVVVVDAANTLSTKEMAKLVRAVARGGGQLVMVGDRSALQAFRQGGAFAHLVDTYGSAELKENKTQSWRSEKETAASVRAGKAADFLRDLEKGKRLVVGEKRHWVVETLVADWSRQSHADQKRSLVLTGSDRDARELNHRCQESLKECDRIGKQSVTNGKERFHPGDRVLFTRKSKVQGIEGGERGTVTAVHEKLNILTAKLDKGETVTVPLRRWEHVRLAYAATAYQAEARTAERVFVLAGGGTLDRGLATVLASRHRDTVRVYAEERDVGKNSYLLRSRMERVREETLAHKHLDLDRQRRREDRAQERTLSL